ncbi:MULTISPECIES: hypothetical protein [unclassified Campylobacter]|uniref:hypothetical protein n=1 Tax=unclassified Campylobacter TaxID=2593542 RepID=UPI0022E9B720|nr:MULTISPECIES: hypothetical protein [unclassified Campylobacter]MDA3056233.1 hypothetical protein [Campylobacter sp. CN_NA1]MDA3065378.1 hypothetical protein [Campylobacter sp. CN_NE4]MDA3068204.1 hypothetical protein [Campylobacter sp. CN_NE3]MDA3082831.1 hypothetical protein [Campylobacter sp. CN_EL2]MDA3083431.1 hypothetical protein [Campylobacter sp. CN_NE1]
MKRLFLMILCGVGLSLNLAIADSMPNLENSNSVSLQQNQTELSDEAIKELEKYDRNLHNTPKTEQEKAELEKLIQAVTNADYNATKSILDKSPNLINLNYDIFTTPISAYFDSCIKFRDDDLNSKMPFQSDEYVKERKEKIQAITKGKVFDEKMFELLMSYKPKLYTNDLLPFIIIANESIDDNKTAQIMQIMFDEGMSAELFYPPVFANDIFPNLKKYLIKEPHHMDKIKTMELFFQNLKDKTFTSMIGISTGLGSLGFVDNMSINIKEPINEKQKEYAKSEKYKKMRDRQIEYAKLVKQYGGDEALPSLISLEVTFKYINDQEGLEILKSLGYKEQR